MRYEVDCRGGCVAVVDTEHPCFPSGNGLHASYPEVVRFWMGKRTGDLECPWMVSERTQRKAERLCGRLNRRKREKR